MSHKIKDHSRKKKKIYYLINIIYSTNEIFGKQSESIRFIKFNIVSKNRKNEIGQTVTEITLNTLFCVKWANNELHELL